MVQQKLKAHSEIRHSTRGLHRCGWTMRVGLASRLVPGSWLLPFTHHTDSRGGRPITSRNTGAIISPGLELPPLHQDAGCKNRQLYR